MNASPQPKCRQLTVERLRQVLRYDPDTGIFTWLGHGGYRGKPAGTAKSDGYKQIFIDFVPHRAARLAWLYMTGNHPPSGKIVDHRDGNRSNDRWKNLRLATHADNARNRRPKNRNLPCCGVYRNGSRWTAEIEADGQRHKLGSFRCVEDAVTARCKAEHHFFGDFASQVAKYGGGDGTR
ncbi:HNH endonuclease signature motif containing protein [Notoacmeibacter ruber]|uniref:HNH endonuclease n=1 Tax=Notoacmeibacter ruber TaxID=2670375 RepID=A0A3L7JF29_9HYPH|nr:HNH endonuclease signature motif containing protein [Notoacmeibacter ruber]RLQ87082.1 HNH endonuclease [Notoacmeibacter ruber]